LKNSAVPRIMLLLLFAGFVAFTFNFDVEPAKAWTGTIYIRADGSIDPPDAPIITYDKVTYILTDNITSSADGIVVERDNIIINGDGHTINGTGEYWYKGVDLSQRTNVTVQNTQIKNFYYGIMLNYSSNNVIFHNNVINSDFFGNIWLINSSNNAIINNTIKKGWFGIYLTYSSYNNIYGNNIAEILEIGGITLDHSSHNTIQRNNVTEGHGLWFWGSSNNKIIQNNINTSITSTYIGYRGHIELIDSPGNIFYYNNFFVNSSDIYTRNSTNVWDNGYPSGGNYWSNYTGVDNYSGPYQDRLGSDGIGDTPYVIDENNEDRYPLMKPLSPPPPDYPFAEWIESPNYTPDDERNITYIVIHVMDGYFEGTIDWFQNPDSQASAHYLISQEGEIVQMVREKDIAWHAGNWEYNQRSIGIEHEDKGNWDKPNWATEELYQASAALVRYLCDKYGIPKDRNHIIGHNEVPGVTKPCPGPYWDWDYFMGLVKGVSAPRKFWAVWENVDYPVLILSNSTVSNFTFNQSEAIISFNLTGPSGAKGFCNVTIPKNLLRDNPWTITVNGVPITDFSKTENDTHSFIYFTYTHTSTLQVTIQGTWVIPEFPLGAVLLGSLVLITIPLVLIKKRCRRKAKP